MKFSAYIATSVDGFIADEHGGIGWLDEASALIPSGEDCGYGDFFRSVDVIVIGRKTFEQVLSFPEWPYGETPVVVLSRTMGAMPASVPGTVSLSTLQPSGLAEQLARAGRTHAYVDGGRVIQSFLSARLLDELTITVVPLVLGAGIPLFGVLDIPQPLTLLRSRAYDFGFVQSTYACGVA